MTCLFVPGSGPVCVVVAGIRTPALSTFGQSKWTLFQFPLMFWGWFSKVYESLHSQTLRSKKNVEPSSDLRERGKKRTNKQTDKRRQNAFKGRRKSLDFAAIAFRQKIGFLKDCNKVT